MNRWLYFALLAATPLTSYEGEVLAQAETTTYVLSTAVEPYTAKDFSNLLGMDGISDKTLEMHFKLYQGYVKNANLLLDLLQKARKEGKERSVQAAEIRRRLMWEIDGMRLHELYFSNMGAYKQGLPKDRPLYKALIAQFGSYENWKADFIATGAMRGIGWAILYRDPKTGRLINAWIQEHDHGHLAGGEPLLIMDVWEHAYLLDYGTDRMAYIDAFFNNIDWDVVSARFPEGKSK